MLMSGNEGSPVTAEPLAKRTSCEASTMPAVPPTAARSRLSTNTRRATRPEDAPRAARMAISGAREEARVTIIVATFEQTIRSTAATAPSSTASVVPERPDATSAKGTRFTYQPVLVSG